MNDQTPPNSAAARDVRNVLHPYTNLRAHEEKGPLVIERGEGVHVFDDEGNRYIEGMAGLWSVAVGFSEQRLVEAATRQMQKLPYGHTFSHRSHDPCIDLSEKLVQMTPEGLDHVFFTNSGSEANDTVIKMVRYLNNARGLPQKKKFIARERGYHGVTLASASLTGLPLNHGDFDLPIAGVLHTGCAHYYRNAEPGETELDFSERRARELEEMILAEGPETVAAFIGEPVMGAGGVYVPPEGYWEKIQAVCRKYDVLIVADEVITGFGRTGRMFGCETFGIEPDILVLSKQISSSYMPLAAVVVSDAIYQDIADNSAKLGAFGHGFTGSGHPVATAVGLENLKIIEERDLVGNAARVGAKLQEGLRALSNHPLVGEVRGIGLIAAVELVADKDSRASFDPVGKIGPELVARCQAHGLLLRPILDSVAFCPPMVISEAEVDEMLAAFRAALDETMGWAEDTLGWTAPA
ncbi:aminotransferase class III-fold pyridoxal phosphate-dependent enzyme [Aquicoccus sp. SCR17]|nr:aminotransferase class III-fold pyridoxal phosphate-dependent enzyme [Carideicomes alvinocaridis]